MREAGAAPFQNILDMACGHGRVLRILKTAFPSASLTACDINRDGVDFCARVFGATPIYSQIEPEEIDLGGKFDLIWSGSLFTHLDLDRWRSFLSLLESSLAPGGLLVFTTGTAAGLVALRLVGLEEQVQKMLEDYERTGFGYAEYPGQERFGLTIVAPVWVRQEIDRHPNLRLVSYEEKKWYTPEPRQDVVACVRV